jgi:nucleotide-binding universal stress UspA family protein
MKPFKKVFVALDESQAARHAVEYAAHLAQRGGATITFCHSVNLAAPHRHASFDRANNLAKLAQLRRAGRARLADAQAVASARSVTAGALELASSTAAATVNAALRRGASAIVVGTEAANRRASGSGDSLADDVLRLSEGPVIVVSRPFVAPAPASSIVVAIDGSAAARRALDFALDLAVDGRARVVAMHVLAKHVTDHDVRERRALLADVVAYAARRGVTIDAAFGRGHVIDELAASVKVLKADLLVVGSHGPSGLRALPIPSVGKLAAREVPCPVAIVRASESMRLLPPAKIPLALAS